MMNVDDVLLAKRITERDEEAFKILYEEVLSCVTFCCV